MSKGGALAAIVGQDYGYVGELQTLGPRTRDTPAQQMRSVGCANVSSAFAKC